MRGRIEQQELGRQDDAEAAYRRALALDRGLYPIVLKGLTTASRGRLDLRPSARRAALLP